MFIAALAAYLIFKQTSNKEKSIVFGILITTFIGVVKEVVDPYLGGEIDKYDLIYTFLGGVVGSVIILSKKSARRK